MKSNFKAKQKPLKERAKKIAFKFIPIFAAILVIIICLYIPKLRIKAVVITPDSPLKIQINETAENTLKEKIFYIIPRDNILILKNKTLEDRILSVISSVKSVTVKKDLNIFNSNKNAVVINFEEKQKIGAYCASYNIEESAAKQDVQKEKIPCFFTDESGRLFEEFDYKNLNEELAKNKFLIFDSKDKILNKGDFLTEEKFDPILEFIKIIKKDFNFEAEKIIFTKKNYEIYLKEGWHIKTDAESLDPAKIKITLDNLKLTLDTQIKERRRNLEYIDLRFQNKVYFKYR